MKVAGGSAFPLTDGYNGNLTSRQNEPVGGYIVKKMIEAQEQQMSGQNGMSGQSGMGAPRCKSCRKNRQKTGAEFFSRSCLFRMITVLHFRFTSPFYNIVSFVFFGFSDKR